VFGTVLLGRLQGGMEMERAMGLYLNTLPLRIALGPRNVAQVIRETYQRLRELLEHEHAALSLAQRCSGMAPSTPLISALFNYRHSSTVAQHAETAWDGVRLIRAEERTNYPLTLSVDALPEDFVISAICAPAIPAQRVVASVATAIEALLDAMDQDKPAHSLNILPPVERHQILTGFNATAIPYPQDTLIHQLFEAQVARTPEAIALSFEDAHLNYTELNERANRLAHHLRSLGVVPDALVAVCLERSIEMVVGLFAILKAGGAYVPLDPSYPQERLAHMLADSAPVAILAHGATTDLLQQLNPAVPLIDLDTDSAAWAALPAANPEPQAIGLTSRHLAYVIYTSGSTGQPKGVMNEHRAVVNRLLWTQDAYGLKAHDTVLQKTPFSFDVSVWEFFWPLSCGARLVMARPLGHQDPDYLREVICRESITTIHFVPAMLQLFLAHQELGRCTSLRRILCSGEALPAALVARFHALSRHLQQTHQLQPIELYNLYGPTEAAVDVTAWHCAPDTPYKVIPIGKPIANTQAYVLDRHLQPVPVGVAGELYLGGVQIARGYLNRAELTAQRFIADPFSDAPEARLYKTGDVARWLPDGNIEYLGRNDFQVKIRGLRIELGEIEATLLACAGVREAVVLAREDQPGDKRLVAYIVAEGDAPSVAELRTELAKTLAEHMLPSAFVVLDALPLSPNGKLERKALPAPDLSALLARTYAAPEGDVETTIALLWQELLGVPKVGRHDHFFELGGHSILAVQLAVRVREQCHVDVPIGSIFQQPQLSEFAGFVTSLQLEVFLGDEAESMLEELDGLTEEELMAILAEDATNE